MTTSDLRCRRAECVAESGDGQHFDHELRDAVAEAIRNFPNTDARWWIGPEVVLGEVEKFLGWAE